MLDACVTSSNGSNAITCVSRITDNAKRLGRLGPPEPRCALSWDPQPLTFGAQKSRVRTRLYAPGNRLASYQRLMRQRPGRKGAGRASAQRHSSRGSRTRAPFTKLRPDYLTNSNLLVVVATQETLCLNPVRQADRAEEHNPRECRTEAQHCGNCAGQQPQQGQDKQNLHRGAPTLLNEKRPERLGSSGSLHPRAGGIVSVSVATRWTGVRTGSPFRVDPPRWGGESQGCVYRDFAVSSVTYVTVPDRCAAGPTLSVSGENEGRAVSVFAVSWSAIERSSA